MRSLVLYYSNTGNTQKVAAVLARELQAELGEITCARYLRWYAPLAMAWDIFTRATPRIDVLSAPGAHYDLVVLGGPVWAARVAPPVLSALKSFELDQARVGLFVTCAGTSPSSPPETAIAEMVAARGSGPTRTEIFRAADIQSGSFTAQAALFARSLSALVDAG